MEKIRGEQRNPGPQSYAPNYSKIIKRNAPQISFTSAKRFTGKSQDEEKSPSPGPAAYNTDQAFRRKPNIARFPTARREGFKFGSE